MKAENQPNAPEMPVGADMIQFKIKEESDYELTDLGMLWEVQCFFSRFFFK